MKKMGAEGAPKRAEGAQGITLRFSAA